jgi:PAS domain S-box-containing protein
MLAVARDVTERKRVEEDLSQLAAIVKTSKDAIVSGTLDGIVTTWNPGAEELFGYTAEEMVGSVASILIPSERRQELSESLEEIEQGRSVEIDETVRVTKDDERIWVSITLSPLKDSKGKVTGASRIMRDITERKRAEEAVRASEASLAEAQRIAHLGSWEMEPLRRGAPIPEHKICWSDEAYRIFGYARQQFVPTFKSLIEAIHPEDREYVGGTIRGSLARRETSAVVEHRILRPDGEVRFVQARMEMVYQESGGLVSHFGTILDITERKRDEQELQKSESRLLAAQRIASVGNWSFDVTANKAYWSDELYRIFGLSPQEEPAPTYKRFLSRVHPCDRALVRQAFREALDGGSRSSIDYRVVRPDGEVRFVHSQYEVKYDASGRAVELIGILQDITDRKLAEGALAESEERYRYLVELSPEAVMVHSEGKLIYANDATARLLGAASAEELIGKPIMQFAHPDYREMGAERIREAFATGKPIPLEGEEIVRLDGDAVDVEVTGVPIVYGGKPAIQLLARDIRERKQAAEALRQSEERFRSLAQNASDVVEIIGPDAIIHYVSPPVERVRGYKPEELISTNGLDLVHPDDLERTHRLLAQVLSGPGTEVTAELRVRHADGSWRYLEAVSKNLIDDPSIGGVVVNYRDITERKRTEEDLQKSEMRLLEAQRLARVGSWDWDIAAGTVTWSDELHRIYGVSPRSFGGTYEAFVELMDPEYRGTVEEMIRRSLEERKPFAHERRIIRPNGEEQVIEARAEVFVDESGEPIRMAGTVQDVTERKRAEAELRKSEERFRSLVQNSQDVITVADPNGKVLYRSPSIEQVMGYKPEELLDKDVQEAVPVHPDDLPHVRRVIDDALDNPGVSYSLELRMRHADGSWRILESSVMNLLDNPNVGGIVSNYRDITERKRAEEQLKY